MKPEDLNSGDVVFFDLFGTLVARRDARFSVLPAIQPWLDISNRLGVLCNLVAGREAREIERILEDAEIDGHFDRALLIAASNLPAALPDRRAFAVAAALAEVPIGQCVFLSNDAALRDAAVTAGMRSGSGVWPPSADRSRGAELLAGAEEPRAGLLAGEVDEDLGPTFVLKGRVVTMNASREVHEEGQVAISNGRIVAVAPLGQALPPAFENAPSIDTKGTLYPGLMDLHNHFVYNVIDLWTVPKRYEDRGQWQRAPSYGAEVSMPVRTLAEVPSSARALVRYVEAKALIGGTTTGQGIRTKVNGGIKLFRGAMRNVEVTSDARLPEAGTLVPNLIVDETHVAAFRKALASRTAYFYHLAEGVNDRARQAYNDLVESQLVQKSLVGIHCLGLHPDDLNSLTAAGAKAVWSPLSNLLLYGRTLDLEAVKSAGVPLALGCDWSPSGSKNLLQELKVARWVVDAQGVSLSDADLVSCVTDAPARTLGWAPYLGSLTEQAFADVLVIDGVAGDPYQHLIKAREADIRLLLIHGVARYGERSLMERLHTTPEFPLESWTLAGSERAFNLRTPDSELNDVSFAAAAESLSAAMSDLPGFRERAGGERAKLASFGLEEAPSFVVELDNEYEPTPEELQAEPAVAGLTADWSRMVDSVALDTPIVAEDAYWQRLSAATNLPEGLAASLRAAYGG